MGGRRVRVELQFNIRIQRLMIPADSTPPPSQAVAANPFDEAEEDAGFLAMLTHDAHHGQGQRIAGAAGHRLKEEGKALILLCGEAVAILILRSGDLPGAAQPKQATASLFSWITSR